MQGSGRSQQEWTREEVTKGTYRSCAPGVSVAACEGVWQPAGGRQVKCCGETASQSTDRDDRGCIPAVWHVRHYTFQPLLLEGSSLLQGVLPLLLIRISLLLKLDLHSKCSLRCTWAMGIAWSSMCLAHVSASSC